MLVQIYGHTLVQSQMWRCPTWPCRFISRPVRMVASETAQKSASGTEGIMQMSLQTFQSSPASLQPAHFIPSVPSLALALWAELFQSCLGVCTPCVRALGILCSRHNQCISALDCENYYPRSARSEILVDLNEFKGKCLLFSGRAQLWRQRISVLCIWYLCLVRYWGS